MDVVEIREDTLRHMATSLTSSVEVGNIGAFGFEKVGQRKRMMRQWKNIIWWSLLVSLIS